MKCGRVLFVIMGAVVNTPAYFALAQLLEAPAAFLLIVVGTMALVARPGYIRLQFLTQSVV